MLVKPQARVIAALILGPVIVAGLYTSARGVLGVTA